MNRCTGNRFFPFATLRSKYFRHVETNPTSDPPAAAMELQVVQLNRMCAEGDAISVV